MNELCEHCEVVEAIKGQKYCKVCKKEVLQEMRAVGYLRSTGDNHCGQRRTSEMKENTYETKYGINR